LRSFSPSFDDILNPNRLTLMKHLIKHNIGIFLVVCLSFSPLFAQKKGQDKKVKGGKAEQKETLPPAPAIPQTASYQFSMDLTKVKDDKLMVEVITPKVTENEAVYCMPKIVPGTYSIYDFGRFLSNFKAYNAVGEELTVENLDENRWKIKNAQSLYKITYWVEDSYDTNLGNFVFEPAGTNIEENKNFVVNAHGFIGYIDGMKRNDYEVNITKPEGFFGATSLQNISNTPSTDKFVVDDYMQLADAPIMYAQPDTTIMQVGGAEILISVYSPSKKLSSKFVSEQIAPILNAQKDYLGGKLPVNRYAFIIYLFQGFSGSGMMGALEHSHSSLYYLLDTDPNDLAQFIKDVAAHEFFHIVTPLSIHSKEIHDFDYINPQMSKHLWLYEGCIEYFAGHVQVKHGLMSEEDYFNVIIGKINEAKSYKDKLPFTLMSKGCLREHKSQYQNVYAKGALIGMCLDIKLRQLSGGSYGIQNLILDLAKQYGKDKPFDDEELFDKIIEVSKFTELRKFFADYVEGENPLPLKEIFKSVGLKYDVTEKVPSLSLGMELTFDEATGFFSIEKIDETNAKSGIQKGDYLVAINKSRITQQNYRDVFDEVKKKGKEGEKYTVTIERVENGKRKEKKVKATMVTVNEYNYLPLAIDEKATSEQIKLRNAWLKVSP
jgi:predicted metalloprotease with PDZ domain